MPVTTTVPIQTIDQPAFHVVDEVVTGIAFDIHNQFGRYLHELLYQAELNKRLRARGFDSIREMTITVFFDDFAKNYQVDFLINGGVIVETKTVETLGPQHRAQVLNYLFLCGLQHATLLNLRSERVEHEFVSTQFTLQQRRQVTVQNRNWRPLSRACDLLAKTIARLIADWGACLDPALYRDAATHILGGESEVVRDVPIMSGGELLGTQKVHLLTDDIAFSFTASVHKTEAVLKHQRRFLEHTPLRAIQWIHLNRQLITLHTITK